MKNLKWLISVLLVSFMLFSVAACGGSGGTTSTPSNTGGSSSSGTSGGGAVSTDEYVKYTIGITDYLGRFIQGLVPTECPSAVYAVFDRIFKVDPVTKELMSDCLESWGWEDNNTFVMTLRPGVYFSNGVEATSADLLYTYTSFPERSATTLDTYGIIWDQCEERDKYTVSIKFERPFRPFTNLFAALICKSWAQEVGWDSMDWYQPVSSGPYKCVEFVSEDLIRLQARDDYWNKDLGPIYVDEWELKYYKDASTMYMDLEVGKIDFAEVQATDYSRFMRSGGSGFDCIMMLSGVNQYYTFSFTDTDVWKDKRLREAVAIGINWDQLGSVAFNDLFVPAKSMMPTAAPNFIDPGTYEYNVERAKALLAEAGYGPSSPLKCYTLLMDSQLYKALGENLQFQFGQIGIQLELEFADIASAINVWNAPGGNDVGFWWNINGSPAFDMYNAMPAALNGTPTFVYVPPDLFPEFTNIFNRIVYTADIADANQAMKDMQQYCYDEFLYIPYLEMSGAFGYRTDRFTEEQVRNFVTFVNMYQLDKAGFATAWQ